MSRGGSCLGVERVVAHSSVDGLREVSLQASAGFGRALSLCSFAFEVRAGGGVPAGVDHGDGEQGPVELAKAAAVWAMPGVSTRGWHGRGAGVRGEGSCCRETIDSACLTEDLGGDDRPDAAEPLDVPRRRLASAPPFGASSGVTAARREASAGLEASHGSTLVRIVAER